MKKISSMVLLAGAVFAFGISALTGCRSKRDANTLVVGICAGPYGDMFKDAIAPSLKEKGYKLKYLEFSDYVQPNNALAEKDIDVNLFQHSIYLKNFSATHKLDLVYLTEVPTAAMGIFSEKFKSLDDVSNGSIVAIPNDDTNLARALRVLEQTGIITLDSEKDSRTATVKDVVFNPKNLKFKEVSAEILPSVLDSVGIAVINGNYAIGAGLRLVDALYNEQLLPGYFNVIAVRSEDKDKDFAKDIYAAVHSDAFRKVVEDPSKQYSAFGKPADYDR